MTVDEDKISVTRPRATRSNSAVSAAFAAFATDQRKRDRDDCDSAVNDKSEVSGPDRKKQNTSDDKEKIIAASSVTIITEDNTSVIPTLNSNIQTTEDNTIDHSNGTYALNNNNHHGITNPLLLNTIYNSENNEDPITILSPIKLQSTIPTNNSMTAATFTKKLSPIRDTIIADSTISPVHNPERKAKSVSSSGYLLWFVFPFTFTVMFWMIWSGLLLNERTTCQLESFECRERLQQIYHEIGIPTEDVDLNSINADNDVLDEQRYYWQELEAQVKYWKKEAKKFQQYSDGYKDQCNDDLRRLLQDVVQPQV